MAAHPLGGDELVDRPVPVDDVVRADARQLVELHVGHVAGEGVVGRAEVVGGRVVLDDHVRVREPVVVDPVVAARVAAHLGPPLGPERDRLLNDSRPCRRRRRRATRAALATARTAPAWRSAPAREGAGGQLDHERRGAAEAVVEPADRGAGVRADLAPRQPGALRVEALEPGVAGVVGHEPQVLVVPDRHVRADPLGERRQRPRLGLRQRSGAGVVELVEAPPHGMPAPGKLRLRSTPWAFWRVPAARPSGLTVFTSQSCTSRGGGCAASVRITAWPGGLVAVDHTNHEHLGGGVRRPEAHGADRPASGRVPDRLPCGRRPGRWPGGRRRRRPRAD